MTRIYKNSSRYTRTNNVDFYLDIWDHPSFGSNINDKSFTIPPEHHLRPDKTSYQLYNTPTYWWVFALLNKNILRDPINDYIAGTIIKIPSKERLENELA